MLRRPSPFLATRSFARLVLCAVTMSALLSATAVRAAEAKFTWHDDAQANVCDLKLGDQLVIRYMYAYDPSTKERLHDTYKPFHHVFGPGSDKLITKGPGGDFTHHRGLYYAWNKTSYAGGSNDFWHCTMGTHQKHAKFIEKTGDDKQGSMTAEIHWNDKEGKPVIIETRKLTVSKLPVDQAPGYGWQIDFTSTISSQRGKITLDGDRQHAGFQYRADQPVAVAKSARYVRPAGFPEDPKAFEVSDGKDPNGHINLGWLCMYYELDGKKYNVQYCEDPSLPKPSRYSERPYGRFGAFFKTEIDTDKPLTVNYRLNITTGDTPTRDVLQKRFETFTAGAKKADTK